MDQERFYRQSAQDDQKRFVAKLLNGGAAQEMLNAWGDGPAGGSTNVEAAGTASVSPSSTLSEVPLTNRGQNVTFGVHWLAVTLHDVGASEVCEALALRFFGATPFDDPFEHWEELGHGGRAYADIRRRGPLTVYSSPMGGGNHVHVEMKGEFCETVTPSDLQGWLQDVERMCSRWNCTRVDLAFDYCPFAPRMLYEAACSGDISCRVRRKDGWIEWLETPPGEEHDPDDERRSGTTFNLGTRKSPRFVRCYDKRGYTRFEMQCSKEWAFAVASGLMATPPDAWGEFALGHVLSFVAFFDRRDDSNSTRAAERAFDWWRSFVGSARKAGPIVRHVVKRTVEGVVNRARRVAKAVAKLNYCLGRQVMKRLIRREAAGLNEVERRRCELLRRDIAEVRRAVPVPIEDVSADSAWLYAMAGVTMHR